MRSAKAFRGFTLIELMIAVAIVGILAAIAYPSYTQFVIRSERANARASSMQMAQCLERTFSLNNVYVAAGCNGGFNTNRYTVAVAVGNPATTYTITATPISPWSDAACGTLQINNLGAKSSSAGTIATCWDK